MWRYKGNSNWLKPKTEYTHETHSTWTITVNLGSYLLLETGVYKLQNFWSKVLK